MGLCAVREIKLKLHIIRRLCVVKYLLLSKIFKKNLSVNNNNIQVSSSIILIYGSRFLDARQSGDILMRRFLYMPEDGDVHRLL